MAKEEKEIAKSKRDAHIERMAKRHPEQEYADDEALFGQIGADYDDYENQIADRDSQLKEYQDREGALSGLFNSDPRSAAFMQAWRGGQDPAVVLMEMFGDEIIDAINDPEKMEEITQARNKYLERVAQETKNTETYKENLAASLQMLEQYQQQKGLSDEQVDQVMESLIKVVGDAVMGKFEPETIDMMLKAQNYDADVESAGIDGEVRGRNAKIDEKLRKGRMSDGVANLSGSNGASTAMDTPNLGALGNYGAGNTTIYERGGEKRIRGRR